MSQIFSGCSSLISLPNISRWNTINVSNMSQIFSGCSSLKSLPDISRWNIDKVIDILEMFSECSSLKEIPDISNWNTNTVKHKIMSPPLKIILALEMGVSQFFSGVWGCSRQEEDGGTHGSPSLLPSKLIKRNKIKLKK